MSVPFKISIPESDLETLKAKLASIRFPDELDDSGWDYGVPLSDIKRLVNHWREGYNWRKEESGINDALPQFTRDIEVEGHGKLNIHYVHQTSEVSGAIPLLIVHGWPGLFYEVVKILPLLTRPSDDRSPAFHVVAPSLPNFGFSEGVKTKGFALEQYGDVCHNLMLELGYDEYVVQGGDWGQAIGLSIAKKHGPMHCKACHRSTNIIRPPSFSSHPFIWLKNMITPLTPAERLRLIGAHLYQKKGSGYYVQQCTQPQTLGYSLADSPVGLLGWVYEKLHNWVDKYPWTDDEILTWISIYWFSRAGPAASVRIYYEYFQVGFSQFLEPLHNVPLGVSSFPGDISNGRKFWNKTLGNVIFQREHESGGHFAAYEKPELLAKDLGDMFGKKGPAYQVVKKASGY